MKTYSKFVKLSLFVAALGLFFNFTGASEVKNADNNTEKIRGNNYIYITDLSGDNEVPAVDTSARGKAIIRINKSETEIYYKIIVNNLDTPTAAHFHMGTAGNTGGVVATLYMGGADGTTNGLLAEGVITAEDADVTMIIESIRAGSIYVNVHTPENPSGELRGQL